MPIYGCSAFNGENYYYISNGILYEDNEKFYTEQKVSSVFANSSYVFAVSENDVKVFDFEGKQQDIINISNITEIYGDDDYVFLYHSESTGYFCDCYSIADSELFSVNELADKEYDAKKYCQLSLFDGVAIGDQFTYFDIGEWKVAAITNQANTPDINRFSDIYLYNENVKVQSRLFNVNSCGEMFLFDDNEIHCISEDFEVNTLKLPDEYGNIAKTNAYVKYPLENIIITEQNEGYLEPFYEPWEDYHECSKVFTYSEENGNFELLFETDETAQIVGCFEGKAIIIEYDDLRVYTDDLNGNKVDICILDSDKFYKYIYFEVTGNKLYIFTSKVNNNLDTEMIYSYELS